MAAPHVAGVAALIMTANPDLTPAQVEEILKQTARPLPGTCDTGACGAGLVDAGAAVRAANPDWQQPAPDPVVAGTPIIAGGAKVGSTLTADPGTWTPAPVGVTYQWLRSDNPIPGATEKSYPPCRRRHRGNPHGTRHRNQGRVRARDGSLRPDRPCAAGDAL